MSHLQNCLDFKDEDVWSQDSWRSACLYKFHFFVLQVTFVVFWEAATLWLWGNTAAFPALLCNAVLHKHVILPMRQEMPYRCTGGLKKGVSDCSRRLEKPLHSEIFLQRKTERKCFHWGHYWIVAGRVKGQWLCQWQIIIPRLCFRGGMEPQRMPSSSTERSWKWGSRWTSTLTWAAMKSTSCFTKVGGKNPSQTATFVV